jgi:hypothetical protein
LVISHASFHLPPSLPTHLQMADQHGQLLAMEASVSKTKVSYAKRLKLPTPDVDVVDPSDEVHE